MMKEEPTPSGSQDKLAFRIAYLIAGFINERLTVQENEELDNWVTSSIDNQILFEELTDEKNVDKWLQWKQELPTNKVLERIKEKIYFPAIRKHSRLKRFLPYAIAASLFVLVATSVVLYKKPGTTGEKNVARKTVNDISPGTNKAVLTLSDGSTIMLDGAKNGSLAQQGNQNIIKDVDGKIRYQIFDPEVQQDAIKYNSLTTPKGGQYQVVLPDGTKVWLNAASSLQYPTDFLKNERKVELKGEAYFEVIKDAAHPFIVSTNGTTVQVLGTHFNVNAYTDEPTVNVTLTEGSVKINQSVVIKPGEQAQINGNGTIKTIQADLLSTLAWKDGIFIFKHAAIEEIMRQVSRWYDADVSYQSTITQHFNASISRNVPVSKILNLLEQTGSVHFKIENKKIYIMK